MNMSDKNWQLGEGDIFSTAAPDTIEYLPSRHCAPVVPQAVAAPEKCWSVNNEEFNYLTLGDLLDSNEELNAGDTIYVGEAKHPGARELCDADDVIETMGDRASDIAGEYADSYPDVTDEAKAELNAFLSSWIEKHASPGFYSVHNARPHILSADDFEPCEVPA